MFYNALGDLFREHGDSLKAIEYYERTLSIRNRPFRLLILRILQPLFSGSVCEPEKAADCH